MRGAQESSRDKEREADAQTIATHLESLYGQEIRSGATVVKPSGSYPSRNAISNATYYGVIFADLPKNADISPGLTARSLSSATTAEYNKDKYVYVPQSGLAGNDCQLISSECRTFRIYFKLESGKNRYIESRHK